MTDSDPSGFHPSQFDPSRGEPSDGEILPARGRGAGGPADGPGSDYSRRGAGPASPFGPGETGDVGDFRQGSAHVRWALSRYLLGRLIIARVSAGLLFTAFLIAVLGGLVYWAGGRWLAVLIFLVALGVVVIRWVFVTVVRRLTFDARFGPAERQLRRIIGAAGGDLRRELHRIGVPLSWWSFPLLLLRLMRSRSRRVLFERMRGFQLERAVPAGRVDELHMLIASARRDGL
jgi:hypothetical protein